MLQPVILNQGLKALINGQKASLRLTQIGLGDAMYTPEENATSLRNELRRIEPLYHERTGPGAVSLSFLLDREDAGFRIGEIGFYAEIEESGKSREILFAVCSRENEPLAYHLKNNRTHMNYTLLFKDGAQNITFEQGPIRYEDLFLEQHAKTAGKISELERIILEQDKRIKRLEERIA